MAFPNVSDIIATTIEARSGKIADNVTSNNALLARLKEKGRIRTVSGGRLIYEELSFAENANGGWYSGYDTLSVSAQDVLSAAEFPFKQLAVPVVVSGLELLQNAGKEQVIDLLEARLAVAEGTMSNIISEGLYSDGTGSGGKQLTGLNAAVPTDPTTGTYGGINRATWAFWKSQLHDTQTSKDTIQAAMNVLWAKCVRGADRPDLIIMGGTIWGQFLGSLQAIQRITDASSAKLGFPSLKYMDADVVLDGGIGGDAVATDAYFLNTKYLHFRPHKDRNMVALSPQRRSAINQDAEVQILGWAGNLTCSGAQFQGRGTFD
jgi:hypothetical protein